MRNLALRVERLEALLALAFARAAGGGGGAADEPVLGVIYRQGGVAGGNVLTTWPQVKQAIANAHGVLRVYVDSSITSPSLVQTGDVTDCLGNVELWPYNKNGAVRDTLVVKNGSTLHRIRGVFGPLTLQVENVTTAGLTFANDDEIVVQGDSPAATAIIEGLTGATLPVIDLHAAAQTILVEANYAQLESDTVGVPFFGLGAVSTAVVSASFVVYEGLVVTGTAGSTLEIINLDASTLFPPASQLAGFTGTLLEFIEPNAPGTSAYDTPWFALTDIYWDPQAGNDSNTGQLGSPLLTFGEIIRRYGSYSPRMAYGQVTTVHQLTAQPAAQDEVVFEPICSGTGQFILDVTLASAGADFGAGALSGGYGYAGAAASAGGVQMTMAAPPAYVVAGVLLENTARGSYAFVDAITGGNAVLTQPQTKASLRNTATNGVPAVDNDWVAGDNIKAWTCQRTNLLRWSPKGSDRNAATQETGGFVFGAGIEDIAGNGTSGFIFLNQADRGVLSFCRIDSRCQVNSVGGPVGAANVWGCYCAGLMTFVSGNANAMYGGCNKAGTTILGNNTAFANNASLHGQSQSYGAFTVISTPGVFNDGNWNQIGGIVNVQGKHWGSYTVTVNAGSTYLNGTGSTFVLQALLTTGALHLGTATTGSSYSGGGVMVDGVNLTPANIDAGGAGGVGLQNPKTGARYCNPI
jgi:hypothetical protein